MKLILFCLTDVVSAYKELQQEKIALEDSLRALSCARSSKDNSPRSLNKNEPVESLSDGNATVAAFTDSSTESAVEKV